MKTIDHGRADVGRRSCPWRSSPAPRPGPTVRSSMMVSGAGSAPARSRMARSLALCTVKLPEICPEPPRIGSRITGAEITSLSSTMANGLPTFSCVTCGEFARAGGVEAERDDRLAGALVEAGLRVGQVVARDQHALLDHDRASSARLRACSRISSSGGTRPCMRLLRRHVRYRPCGKSSLAVLPSSSFSRVGSCRPGTCTRMRSVPWRWISGSTVPSSLTRRSMIWID